MDLRTGRTYATVEEARKAGVPKSDIAHLVDQYQRFDEIRKMIPRVEFSKFPFKSFKNIKETVNE